jgi:hypothetical protein
MPLHLLAAPRAPLPAAPCSLSLPSCTQYSLPASYNVQPLMARMTAGLVQHGRGAAVVLVTLQWHVPRELRLAPKGAAGR